MKFLSGVAEDGEGSAALPLTRRPDRLLSRRMTNLLIVALMTGVVAAAAAKMVFPSSPRVLTAAGPDETDPALLVGPATPSPSPHDSITPATAGPRRDYAVGLHEIRGLPPDTARGTSLELWVAWDDAYTKRPQVQRLVRSVNLVRFIEPVTREGPVMAVLSVPESAIRAVMYGDLYGSFAAAIPTG